MNLSNISNTSLSNYTTLLPISSESPSFFYSTMQSAPSLFSSLFVPFFWFFALYSLSVFIVALLHFVHDTCPDLRSTKDIEIMERKKASFKEICRESVKYSTLNIQQYVMDIIDIITDIMYSLNAYFLFSTQIVTIVSFAATGLLMVLVAIKWILLRHHALINSRIWSDLVMFDLFTASLCNAVQGGIAFYMLYERQTAWDTIMYIKIAVVGYQMTVKLCRAILFCMCGRKSQYEQQYIKAHFETVPKPEPNKVFSVSDEAEQPPVVESKEVRVESKDGEVESKEVEIELMTAEDTKDSDGVQYDTKVDQMVVDINNYGQLDKTRALLTDLSKTNALSERYEQEWTKNVLLLIGENQTKLRNQSMKPVVKEYVKTLQKDGNADYKRFMVLLQNANDVERERAHDILP